MTGIYKITNLINGKCYIGQAIDIDKRLREHINDSNNPKRREYDYPLSRAYRKYGIVNFQSTILEECSKEELNEKEAYYIKEFNSKKEGYNQTDGGNQITHLWGENHHLAKLTDIEVYQVRELYNQHIPFKTAYEQYSNGMSISGFRKIWLGYTRKNIHPEVYTQENKDYWEYEKNIAGNRLFSDEEILDIRTRAANGEDRLSIYQDYKGRAKHSAEAFNDIFYGRRYKHIKVEPVSTILGSEE